jgi:hypothetical protein
MTYDPIIQIVDEPLVIDGAVIDELRAFRRKAKLQHLPGIDPALERERLAAVLNELADTLVAGIQSNPSKLWVMKQFQRFLVKVEGEDTEGREHFGMEIEEVMDILGIESSDGLLAFYLGGL